MVNPRPRGRQRRFAGSLSSVVVEGLRDAQCLGDLSAPGLLEAFQQVPGKPLHRQALDLASTPPALGGATIVVMHPRPRGAAVRLLPSMMNDLCVSLRRQSGTWRWRLQIRHRRYPSSAVARLAARLCHI